MRSISLILIGLCTSTGVMAKCAGSGIYVLSDAKTLNKNGLIILEFYANSQQYVKGIGTTFPAVLISGKEKVVLNVIEVLQGEMMVTQVVLKPATELIAGNEYTLALQHLPNKDPGPARYSSLTNKWEALRFTVNTTLDNDIPVISTVPTLKKKTYAVYGCGPAKWVYFNLTGIDQSELFVRTTVKNKATGKSTTYILKLKEGQVQVGHGMCSGAFNFDNGNEFEITFQLFDQSGNKGSVSNAISFEKPTVYTNEE